MSRWYGPDKNRHNISKGCVPPCVNRKFILDQRTEETYCPDCGYVVVEWKKCRPR